MAYWWHPTGMIGLDIQPNLLRVVQIKRRGPRCSLGGIGTYSLRDEEWVDVLARVVAKEKWQGCAAAFSVPMEQVVIRRLSLPGGLLGSEVEEEVRAYAERECPGDHVLSLDFIPINASPEEVWCAATRADVTQKIVGIQAAGLQPKVIEIDSLALLRAVGMDERAALLHCVHGVANLLGLHVDGIPFHFRWSCLDLREFNLQLMRHLQGGSLLGQSVNIERLVLSGISEVQLSSCEAWQIENWRSPFQSLTNDYLLAYGLACGETPRW